MAVLISNIFTDQLVSESITQIKTQISIATLVALSTVTALQAGEVCKEPHVRYPLKP
jgi:hypothetical protein